MGSSSETTSYDIGDPVEVSDEVGNYFGVIVDHVDDETLCVQMIKQRADQCYEVTSDAYHVPHDAIAQHVSIDGDDDNAPAAFHSLGFRMIDGSTFVKLSDETGDRMFPVGDPLFDVRSDDDGSSMGSLRDFIVDDDECEPFTIAESNHPFVRETHAAVQQFNDWTPATDQEYSIRRFIQEQEARAVVIDDNIRCSRPNSGPCPNYARPDQ